MISPCAWSSKDIHCRPVKNAVPFRAPHPHKNPPIFPHFHAIDTRELQVHFRSESLSPWSLPAIIKLSVVSAKQHNVSLVCHRWSTIYQSLLLSRLKKKASPVLHKPSLPRKLSHLLHIFSPPSHVLPPPHIFCPPLHTLSPSPQTQHIHKLAINPDVMQPQGSPPLISTSFPVSSPHSLISSLSPSHYLT